MCAKFRRYLLAGTIFSESKQYRDQKGRFQPNFHTKYPIGALFYEKPSTLSISYDCLVPILCIPTNVTHIGNHLALSLRCEPFPYKNPIDLFQNFACTQNMIRSSVMDENWGIHTSVVSQYVCKVSTITYGRNNFF